MHSLKGGVTFGIHKLSVIFLKILFKKANGLWNLYCSCISIDIPCISEYVCIMVNTNATILGTYKLGFVDPYSRVHLTV